MKILIFDSSSLITLSMNGLIYLLEKLKKEFGGRFIIPEHVKNESIDRPLNIKRFRLGAIRINSLLKNNVLELPPKINISNKEVKQKTSEILRIVNKCYQAKDGFLDIIQKGEAACLALSLIASDKKIENALVVDERTTRMIGESPENLRKLFEKKLYTKVDLRENLSFLKNIKFIRSSELVYVAYKKRLVNLEGENVLDALLYATKYKGAAISTQEIEEAKRLKI